MANACRVCIVETHPIQYKAPLFRYLASDPRFDLAVLYAMIPDAAQQGSGFGVPFAWDVPLLEGYRYEVLDNRAKRPSVTCFGGCDTPGIHARLRRDRPDAVLVNGWVVKTCLQTLAACRRLGIPCIVRGEANLLRSRAWWKHALHGLLLRQYSAWLAIGSANRAFYRFHGCCESRIFWAPYAVDNARFAALAVERRSRRAELRAGFGIRSDAIVFLFAGKLEDKKHPLDLLKAVSLLPPAQRCAVHVLVAGDGPRMEECRAFASQLGYPVTFAGFLNQTRMPDAYAAADVLVLPSDAGETWGLVVNEAMASGLPAIVSRSAGCCSDLIVEGETGFSFDVRDCEALAGHLQRYVMEPVLAERQGAHATRHIAGFDFRSVAQGLHGAVRACQSPKGGNERSRVC
jgi:glycosyltransferase involved in cell wall biosynthesis